MAEEAMGVAAAEGKAIPPGKKFRPSRFGLGFKFSVFIGMLVIILIPTVTTIVSSVALGRIRTLLADEKMEKALAEDALKDLEIELGLRTPETPPVTETSKNLGPATEEQTE